MPETRQPEYWEVHQTTGKDYIVVEYSRRRVIPTLYSLELAAWLRASIETLGAIKLLPSYDTEADRRRNLEAWIMEKFDYRSEEEVEFGPYWGPGYEELRSLCLRVRYHDAVDPKVNAEARRRVGQALEEFAAWQEARHAAK